MTLRRLNKDISYLMSTPPENIFFHWDENDMTTIYGVIIGPKNTPYEGGFYLIHMKIPENYPFSPPICKILTTNGGKIRFNPNLYACGKICLSILGTWKGPGWSAGLTLESVFISIQSLLNENPYSNEPGFEKTPITHPKAKAYIDSVKINTFMVAICKNLETPLPGLLSQKIKTYVLENLDSYIILIQRLPISDLEQTKLIERFQKIIVI